MRPARPLLTLGFSESRRLMMTISMQHESLLTTHSCRSVLLIVRQFNINKRTNKTGKGFSFFAQQVCIQIGIFTPKLSLTQIKF
jgi:hypothetical protein